MKGPVMFTRRQLLTAATATPLIGAPAIVRAQSWFAGYPFALGVTSGDPAPDGFVISSGAERLAIVGGRKERREGDR